MLSFESNKHHLRELLIYFFNLKKSAEAHRLLVEAYGDAALSERSCREWFQKFENGEFEVEDKERSGRPKNAPTIILGMTKLFSCMIMLDHMF